MSPRNSDRSAGSRGASAHSCSIGAGLNAAYPQAPITSDSTEGPAASTNASKARRNSGDTWFSSTGAESSYSQNENRQATGPSTSGKGSPIGTSTTGRPANWVAVEWKVIVELRCDGRSGLLLGRDRRAGRRTPIVTAIAANWS